jgi:hypothetical protein
MSDAQKWTRRCSHSSLSCRPRPDEGRAHRRRWLADRGQRRAADVRAPEHRDADREKNQNEGGAHAPPSSNVHTGMPSLRALSARLAETPEPGKTMTPMGSVSRI